MAAPCRSGGDRTAAHEAVRSLAESYGVSLLPLELKTDLTLTPPPPPRARRGRGSESGAAATTAGVLLPEQQALAFDAANLPPSSPGSAASSNGADAVDGELLLLTRGVTSSAAVLPHSEQQQQQPQHDCILSQEELEEYQLPLEKRITLLQVWRTAPPGYSCLRACMHIMHILASPDYSLSNMHARSPSFTSQDERDALVDRLLLTTEALHASEARNRQSAASASQVRKGTGGKVVQLLLQTHTQQVRAGHLSWLGISRI
jgi:hypothetical protein